MCTWEKIWEYKVSFYNKVLLEIVKVNKIKSTLNGTIGFLMTGSCAIVIEGHGKVADGKRKQPG